MGEGPPAVCSPPVIALAIPNEPEVTPAAGPTIFRSSWTLSPASGPPNAVEAIVAAVETALPIKLSMLETFDFIGTAGGGCSVLASTAAAALISASAALPPPEAT